MGSRLWSLGVTWRHLKVTIELCESTFLLVVSDDHASILHGYGDTRHMWFPIGGKLEPSVYLTPLRRYLAPNILESRLWPFEVTWRHRLRDNRTRGGHFSISGQWWPCIYLAQIRRYGDLKILGSRVDLLGSCDVIGHVTIGLGICGFLLAVNWNHASILHHYRDIWLQRYWGHDFDLLRSRDVIGHVTTGLGICGFLLVVHCNQFVYFAPLGRYWAQRYYLLRLIV